MEKAPIGVQADREPNPLTPLSFAAQSGGGGAISDLGAGLAGARGWGGWEVQPIRCPDWV